MNISKKELKQLEDLLYRAKDLVYLDTPGDITKVLEESIYLIHSIEDKHKKTMQTYAKNLTREQHGTTNNKNK